MSAAACVRLDKCGRGGHGLMDELPRGSSGSDAAVIQDEDGENKHKEDGEGGGGGP